MQAFLTDALSGRGAVTVPAVVLGIVAAAAIGLIRHPVSRRTLIALLASAPGVALAIVFASAAPAKSGTRFGWWIVGLITIWLQILVWLVVCGGAYAFASRVRRDR